MSTARRFTVVARVRLLAATTVLFLLVAALIQLADSEDERRRALHKVESLAPASDLMQLARGGAQHRGLTAGFLAQDPAFTQRREAKAAEVGTALDTALAHLARLQSAEVHERSAALRAEWQGLARQVAERALNASDSFARHSTWIAKVLALQEEVVHASGLSQELDARSYHLVQGALLELPQVSELLGQMRARGTGAIARGEASAADRSWLLLRVEMVQARFDAAAASLARAAAAGRGDDLALDEVRRGLAQALALVRQQFETQSGFSIDGTTYFDRLTQAIDQQYALDGRAAAALEQTLGERQRRATWVMAASTAASLVVLLAVMLLAHRTVLSIRRRADLATSAAAAMAERDFTHAAAVDGNDEFADITRSIDAARQAIAQAFAELRAGVNTMNGATREIATGNLDLSARTESQAAAVQETAASIEQLSGGVQQNAGSAREAATLIREAHGAADAGRGQMEQVVQTMQGIAEASRRIADIIGVIDGIAFQTNILALNAAVEAARAGEQGRGFAVVAAEVRSLAQRSAEAAREVRQTIGASGEQVGAGERLVQSAGQAMNGIAEQVARVSHLVEQIGLASSEQSNGLGAVNTAVAQIDQTTQQNAALVEQTAAASESLRSQAEQLVATMAKFRIAAA